MKHEIKCDICNGVDYSELNICPICQRNYCEICDGTHGPITTCEFCSETIIND